MIQVKSSSFEKPGKLVVFGREEPDTDEINDDSTGKLWSIFLNYPWPHKRGDLEIELELIFDKCVLPLPPKPLNLGRETMQILEEAFGPSPELAFRSSLWEGAIMRKWFSSLYERRAKAVGHVVVICNDGEELDRLERSLREVLNNMPPFADIGEIFLHCVLPSNSEESIEHTKGLLSKYGQRTEFFLLVIDSFWGESENILRTLQTLSPEHPELITMIFLPFEGGFPPELLKYCRENNIVVAKRPVNGVKEDPAFLDKLHEMIERSRMTMKVRQRIDAARDCEPSEQIVDMIDSHYDCNLYVCSKEMKEVLKKIAEAANPEHPKPVFIYGETGTGKTPLAIYYLGVLTRFQWNQPFCMIAHLDTSYAAEKYLFGENLSHDWGRQKTKGIFEEAEQGVVFFEELHRLPLDTQTKLLAVTQNKKFTPLGETKPKHFGGVFIGATNEEPQKCIKDRSLRDDLYRRFASAYKIDISPLNDRREDTWAIIIGFSEKNHPGKSIKDVWTEPAIWGLVATDWSGNVRELIEKVRIVLLRVTDRKIQVQDIEDLFENDRELLRQCMFLERTFLKDSKMAERSVESEKNAWVTSQIDRIQRALSEQEFIRLQEKLPEDCPAKRISDFHEWAAAIVRWCGEKDNQERWGILRSHFSAPGVDGIRKGIPQLHRNEWLKGFEKHLKEVNFGPKGNLFDQSRWRKIKNLKMTGAMAWRVFVYQALLGFNHNMKAELDK